MVNLGPLFGELKTCLRKDQFILKRVNKYFASTAALKPQSNEARIRCLALLSEVTDARYASACWKVIGGIKEEEGDIPAAIEAYQKSVDISDATKRLKIIKAGGTPKLAW